jgi:hypothetical protein
MRTRSLAAAISCAIAVLVAGVVGAAPAQAKGVQDATIKGPGLGHTVRVRDDGLRPLLTSAGLYESVFHEPGSAISPTRPAGRLGPRYTVTYGWMIGPDATAPIRQLVYPFARGGAIAYTPPKQHVEGSSEPLDGGWYRGGPRLRTALVALGVPRHAKSEA